MAVRAGCCSGYVAPEPYRPQYTCDVMNRARSLGQTTWLQTLARAVPVPVPPCARASGDTFTTKLPYTMTSMYVPPAVVSLAIDMKAKGEKVDKLSKALSRFQKEDPTFRVGKCSRPRPRPRPLPRPDRATTLFSRPQPPP